MYECVSVQGVLLLKPAVVAEGSTENGQKIVRLWVHEVYRVFYDRLINEEDREMFFKMVKVPLILIKREELLITAINESLASKIYYHPV